MRTAKPAAGAADIQSVGLAIRILESLAENRAPIGVTDLANALGMTKARIYRHLRTLVTLGYVAQDPSTEKYRLGVRFFVLSRAIGELFELVPAARPVAQALVEEFKQTVVVSMVEKNNIYVLEVFRSYSPVEIVTNPGAFLDIHATAQGKVALAYGPPELLERVESAPLRAPTPRTITDPAVLRREVQKVRQRGWAIAPGESLEGVNAIAAPIFDRNGALTGTLGIVGSIQFVPRTPSRRQIEAIVNAGKEISRSLGAKV